MSYRGQTYHLIFVITTGKGTVYVVSGKDELHARDRFMTEYKGHEIASIVRAERFLP